MIGRYDNLGCGHPETKHRQRWDQPQGKFVRLGCFAIDDVDSLDEPLICNCSTYTPGEDPS